VKLVYLEMRFFVIESNHYPFLDGHYLDKKRIHQTVSVGRRGQRDCAAYRHFLDRVGGDQWFCPDESGKNGCQCAHESPGAHFCRGIYAGSEQGEETIMDEVVLCAMCKVRGVCGKGVDRSIAAKAYSNPVDKLTSTVSWPTIWSKYCYFCDKKNTGLIRA